MHTDPEGLAFVLVLLVGGTAVVRLIDRQITRDWESRLPYLAWLNEMDLCERANPQRRPAGATPPRTPVAPARPTPSAGAVTGRAPRPAPAEGPSRVMCRG